MSDIMERKMFRILCVDDEEQALALYKQALGPDDEEFAAVNESGSLADDLFGPSESTVQDRPYLLTMCSNSEDAVAAVDQSVQDKDPYALVFIDMQMPPGNTGLWAAEHIRALDPHVQIAIATAFSDISPADIVARVPPVHKLLYIQKPFHVAEITQFAAALTAKWVTEKTAYSLYRSMEKQVSERTAQLRSSQKKYGDLFEHAHDMIQSVDAEGRFQFINRSWMEALGYHEAELEEMTVFDIIHEDSLDHCRTAFTNLMDTDEAVDLETVFVTKDGKEILVEGNVVPMVEDGKFVATHGFFRDITSRRATENELARTLAVLRKSFMNVINVITSTVETRDPYTAGHQARVADLARTIATKMGLEKSAVEGIRIAGVVHDLGKISIPSEILTKPRRLSELEFSLIKEHSRIGYDLLKPVEFPWPVADMVHQHHERMDGSGYPEGLTGDEILVESRILCVADVVEAMASHRPYRPALGVEAALEEIKGRRGSWFDEQVVDACVAAFTEDGYQFKFE
jgi:PAS domain S-box-containing protein